MTAENIVIKTIVSIGFKQSFRSVDGLVIILH